MASSHDSRFEQNQVNSPRRASDLTIDLYRWATLAGHAVVLLYWTTSSSLTILTKNIEPLCWPYFQQCGQFRFEEPRSTTILLFIQALLIISAGVALVCRCYRTFWITLFAINLYLFSIVSLDYRFRGNQVYMLFWVNAVLLFWSAKRWTIPLILISFYFWAGTLKINYEWLSGSVLYHDLYIIPSRFAWVACTYVVLLEMVAIWGLIARRAWIRWLTLGQLALFHIESISQIQWFYPLLMSMLMSWFLIDWVVAKEPGNLSSTNLWRGRAPRSAYVLLVIFASFQLIPYIYHGNKTLTGQGRIFALDMLEARQVCDVQAVIHHRDQTTDVVDLLLSGLPPRKVCDPIVYYDRMTNLCRSSASDPAFGDADFVMHSKLTTDAVLTTIVDEHDFCGRHEDYKIFSNNSWMK
jgi:hypothetical protein